MGDLISKNTALLLVETTILSIFEYNNIIYTRTIKQQENKLQKVQNWAFRTMFKMGICDVNMEADIEALAQWQDIHPSLHIYTRRKKTTMQSFTEQRDKTGILV